MKLKYIAILLATILLATVIAWVASEYLIDHQIDQSATIATIDVYLDDTLIDDPYSLDWGSVALGETYFYVLKVVNTGASTITVNFVVESLPTDWIQTWEDSSAHTPLVDVVLAPTEEQSGDLTLTIPSTVTPDTYIWTSYVVATET